MTHHRSDEAETYASTTASPPPVQISLDDSIDTEYKESHFLNGSGLITPGTDFSEEGGFFKDVSDDPSEACAPVFESSYSRYRSQIASTPVSSMSSHGRTFVPATMGGCTWHTVQNSPQIQAAVPSAGQGGSSSNPILISQLLNSPHRDPGAPSSNPLSSLTQQIQAAMMAEGSGLGADQTTAAQITEVLMNTVSGLNTLRIALGDNTLAEFLSLLLKDSTTVSSAASGMAYVSTGSGGMVMPSSRPSHLIDEQDDFPPPPTHSSSGYLPLMTVVALKVPSTASPLAKPTDPTGGASSRSTRRRAPDPPRTPVAAALASPVVTPSVSPPSVKRSRRSQPTPVSLPTPLPLPALPPPTSPPVNHAFEQWLDDVSNVDICLSVSMGGPATPATPEPSHPQEEEGGEPRIHQPVIATEFCVSIPMMLSRVLQTKLAIDPSRLETVVKKPQTQTPSEEVFVSVIVKGREEPITEAIEGGLTPRKAFLRTAPHISRVASRLQECMRQIFGMRDFVVKIDA